MTTKTTRLPSHCVYQHGWDEGYRDGAVGDGITTPSRLLIATCDSEEEAERLCEEMTRRVRDQVGPLVPGSNKRVPMFSAGEYNPLDYVGRQNRDQESFGKRYASLCGSLIAGADERRKSLG